MGLRTLSLLIAAVFLFDASAGTAAEKKSLNYWLKNTGSKLQGVSKKQKKETAVAGVKGAPEKAEDRLYWKEGGATVKEAEIKALEGAVELVSKGEKEGAVKALEAFLHDYPKSPLKADAEEGLKILKSEK